MSELLSRIFAHRGIRGWMLACGRYNQYGLLHDDLIHESDEVKEALRRLPEHVIDERNFRIIRALQLDGQKKVLPQEQWTTVDTDIPYLLPTLYEVLEEKAERDKWNAQ